MFNKKLCIITSEWEHGASITGTSLGPAYILEAYAKGKEKKIENIPVINVLQSTLSAEKLGRPQFFKNGSFLNLHQEKFAHHIAQSLHNGFKCLLLTADHSNGIGGISGMCLQVPSQEIGIVWIDAHLDLHSPYTTLSGNAHGMPLNAMLGDNNISESVREIDSETFALWEKTQLIRGSCEPIPTKNIVFIGTRDYEKQEWSLIQKHGIPTISPLEITKKGIDECLKIADKTLAHCSSLYISFDVDALDPSISCATGTPVEGGLTQKMVLDILGHFCKDKRTTCIEITEFNPLLSNPKEMMQSIASLLDCVFLDDPSDTS